MAACPDCGTQASGNQRFCSECGTAISNARARETRKTITVLFCDVQGSTGLGERLEPETFREVLTRYFETAKPIIRAHGGTVYPLMGDGILAVFGVPKLHEDDALRAVRAAVELREALPTLNQDLERGWGVRVATRIGINTGEVAVEDERGHPELLGDPVNIAARLEQTAAPDEIVLGSATWWLARKYVSVESLGLLTLRGRSEPVDAYRLTLFSPPQEEVLSLDAELIGRDQEMAWLRLAYERTVSERTCHLATVLGSVGVGKSRLAAEFCTTIANQASVVRGRCLPYGEGITFWPITVAVRQAAGIGIGDPPEVARARLAALVGEQERGQQITAQVAQLLALADPDGSAQENSFWGVRRLLEILADRRPIVLVVEDLHWAEPSLLDLIEHVAERSREAPILIVCLAREELLEDRPTWGGGKVNTTTILLSPLIQAESDQLISRLLGSTPLALGDKATIARMAEGNPLFIEELVATARDERGLHAATEAAATGNRSEDLVPPAVQAVLATRLERLAPEERTVLERAAVVGVNFSKAAVLGLSEEMSEEQLGVILDALIRKGAIRPYTSDLLPGEGFRFRHGLIRDTTYTAIPKGTRAVLHERLADLGEQTLGDRAREIDAIIIGRDLSEAYRYRIELGPPDEKALQLAERAGELLSGAGRRASGRGDIPATITLLNRALELLAESHPLRLEMLIVLAEALGGAGNLREATATLSTAIDAATRAGDVSKVIRAEIGRLDLQWYTDLEVVLDEGSAKVEHAIKVFEQQGDDSGLVGAWRVLAQIRYGIGRNGAAREAIECAIDAARRTADQRLEARALSNACWIALQGPMPLGEVVPYTESVLEWAERNGSRRLEAHALRVLARAHAMRDDFAKARELIGAASTITTRLGEVLYGASDANSPGFIELLAGDYAAAERALRRSFDMLAGFGVKNQSAGVAGLLARVLLAQDRVAEAEHFAGISKRNAASKEADAQVKWRRAEARILASRSRFPQAARLARQEVKIADQTDWLDLQAEARMDLAHVLRLDRRSQEAHGVVVDALTCYRRKGNLAGARLAQEFLRDLDGGLAAS